MPPVLDVLREWDFLDMPVARHGFAPNNYRLSLVFHNIVVERPSVPAEGA